MKPPAVGLVQAASVGVLVLLGGCSGADAPASANSPAPRASPSPEGATPEAIPPVELVGRSRGRTPIRLTQLRAGRVLYTLVADGLKGHYAGVDSGTSNLVRPHVTFFTRSGKRLIADAPAGTVIERDKTVSMNGGVLARSEAGMTLRSDALRYDDQTEIVHARGHVHVTFPRGERLAGDSADWNLRTGDFEMNSGTP